MIKIFKGYWSLKDVNDHQNWLFIFGDNDVKKGYGGQAIIRACKNAFGIPTKKYPNNKETSFYTDDEFDKNRIKIKNAIKKIYKLANKYDKIILPENGLGTGLSKLNIKAPKTYKYLQKKINKLKQL